MEEDDIRRAQAGDQAAFRRLVEDYTPLAWRVAQMLLQDRHLAEDVLQETWIDVWRGLPRFERGRPLRPWLLTIVTHRCQMVTRRRALPLAPLDAQISDTFPGPDDVPEEVLRQEPDVDLQAALCTLPTEQQRILALRFGADLDLAEIATLTRTPLGTVKSRLHRALGFLREHLGHAPVSLQRQERSR